MAKRNLTDRTLKALKAAKPGRRHEVWDGVVPGFGVRVTDKGRRTFILVARFSDSKHPTRRAIGVYGAITLEKARIKAREWLELVRGGTDPRRRLRFFTFRADGEWPGEYSRVRDSEGSRWLQGPVRHGCIPTREAQHALSGSAFDHRSK